MRRPPFLCCAIAAAIPLPALANYADDTGFNQLKAELGSAMPAGAGVAMTQVEATPSASAYMAQGGTGTFSGTGYWAGKTFTAKSGSSVYSAHASYVAFHMYGGNTDPSLYRAGMCPATATVDCYNANSWDDEFLAPLPGKLAPAVENNAVQNHSWVYDADATNATLVKDLVRRQDFSINRDDYVCCVGLNNGASTAIPDLMASAYNVLSVGVTSGEHSRGEVTPDMDGAGRRKPEIVAPLDATSFSTAYVSSAAGLLWEKGATANGRNSKTLRAVLLAGATKEEFPAWSKSPVHPLDAVFGAGELNIYNSYYILDGGEQPANNPEGRPFRAWDLHTLSSGNTADYRLNIPAGEFGVELSAFLVWNRTLTDGNSPGYNLVPDSPVNFDLTIYRDPSAGGTPVTIDSSTSTLYTLEHVWAKNLPSGNYRLRVSRTAGTSHTFAIAWRLTTAPHSPQPEMARTAASLDFTFPGLIVGQPYLFQSSPDALNWSDLESFTAVSGEFSLSLPQNGSPRQLYRLLPVLP